MPEDNKTPATSVWTLMSDSAMTLQVGIVKAAIVKHNQGKYAQLARFSDESLVEHFLELGMRSTLTAIEADIDRRNKDGFAKESAKLEPPTLVGDATKDAAAIAQYLSAQQALRTTYGIGGDKKEV